MAFGSAAIVVILALAQIAHTQRGPTSFTEFFNDFRENHNEQGLHYSHQYLISDEASQVHILHREQRQGDQVSGSYAYLEPTGHIRSVHYEVRGQGQGFRAVVEQRTGNSRVHQAQEFRGTRPPLRALAIAEPVAFVT
ncbi:hypothetical protein KR018_009605 [Drosophila ironensis]|nr:hypothetical protein KR018_009605 [Drosophila ironensis]